MEINAEISKVFGTEMAKLFANQISEEELLETSKEAWVEITNRPIRWREKEPSQLDEMLRKELVNRLLSKVYEIMKETTSEEWIQKEAERIVNEAKEKHHEMMVDEVARHMTQSVFHNYDISYEINRCAEQIANAIANK
jgi:hypothetical protein